MNSRTISKNYVGSSCVEHFFIFSKFLIQLLTMIIYNRPQLCNNQPQICRLNHNKSLQNMFTRNIARQIYCFSKISKISNSVSQALADVNDNAKILVGGIGYSGFPMNLIAGIREKGVKDLTIVSHDCGVGEGQGKKDWGLGILVRSGQIQRMISSYMGSNAEFERQYYSGQIQFLNIPQRTLAEKIRLGGAGKSTFYTATGVGTVVETGGLAIKYKKQSKQKEVLIQTIPKRVKKINGISYIQQETIFGDVAIVKARFADKLGNLYFNKTENNLNAVMATAAKIVIAQVQQIVEQNSTSQAQNIQVPAKYVSKIFKSDPKCPWSQKLTQNRATQILKQKNDYVSERDKKRLKIIKRAAQQVKYGMNVNLGYGIPKLLPPFLSKDIQINIQRGNVIFGPGPYPSYQTQKVIQHININAGREEISIYPGQLFFSSSKSFLNIKSEDLKLTILGSFQVSLKCDIANWFIPGLFRGIGCSMDLATCGSQVIVVMEHSYKNKRTGRLENKLMQRCSLPLTAKGVVSMVITELAVFQNINGELILTQIANQTTLEQVQNQTDFDIKCAPVLKRF